MPYVCGRSVGGAASGCITQHNEHFFSLSPSPCLPSSYSRESITGWVERTCVHEMGAKIVAHINVVRIFFFSLIKPAFNSKANAHTISSNGKDRTKNKKKKRKQEKELCKMFNSSDRSEKRITWRWDMELQQRRRRRRRQHRGNRIKICMSR